MNPEDEEVLGKMPTELLSLEGSELIRRDIPYPLQLFLLPLPYLLLFLLLPQESHPEEEPRGRDVHAVCATTQTRDGDGREEGGFRARACRTLQPPPAAPERPPTARAASQRSHLFLHNRDFRNILRHLTCSNLLLMDFVVHAQKTLPKEEEKQRHEAHKAPLQWWKIAGTPN